VTAEALPVRRRTVRSMVFRFQSLFGLVAVFVAAVLFSPSRNGELVFQAPWEGRAFGMAVALHDAGLFTWGFSRYAVVCPRCVRGKTRRRAGGRPTPRRANMTSTRRFAAMAASGAVAMLVGGALASPALADTGDHDPNSHAAVTATEHADNSGSADTATHENESAHANQSEPANPSPHTNGGDGNPPGANGTVKIEPASGPVTHANHPHPGCLFRVALFNFDDPSTVHLSFTGQAPTRTGGTLTDTVAYSTDPTVSGPYNLSSLFSGVTPKKQGFHVKLTATQDGAPGAGKHKVFWINCGELSAPAHARPARPTNGPGSGGNGAVAGTQATSAAGTTESGAAPSESSPSGASTNVLGTELNRSAVIGAQLLTSFGAPGSVLASGASPSAAGASAAGTQVLGLEVTRASGAAAATTKPAAVGAASATRGRTLARTGIGVGLLLLLAAAAVVLGGLGRASASRRKVG